MPDAGSAAMSRSPDPAAGVALALEAARDRHAPREPLERAPRRRLGDVLAPQRLARILPAAKLVAVARPEDAVVLGLQHLHRAARKAVGSEHFVLSVGAAPEADGHRVSLTHLSCGSPVDYLCIRWGRLRVFEPPSVLDCPRASSSARRRFTTTRSSP